MNQEITYGNLQAYKSYIRPISNKQYGTAFSKQKNLTVHQQTVRNILSIMAKNEPITIWDMAKVKFANDISKLRYREKKYRRILVGREDRGKHSSGLLESGLVVKDGKSYKKAPADKYRLSLHGILFCMDILRLSDKEMDILAEKYKKILPKVFGKWEFLKYKLESDVYTIKFLGKGLIADNPQISMNLETPFYELMSYVSIKYQRNFENISEELLADQISYWFYSNLLYQPISKNKKQYKGIERLEIILKEDKALHKWFLDFYKEAKNYYKTRYNMMKLKTSN